MSKITPMKLSEDDAIFGYAQRQLLRSTAVLSAEVERLEGELEAAKDRERDLEAKLSAKEAEIEALSTITPKDQDQ
jgi:predicted  nucleic acid-binding Zn-ribbon protein